MVSRTQFESSLRLAGFCTGIGMLERAIETAFSVRGIRADSVFNCEWEASTASVLASLQDASGGEALIHGNMFTANGGFMRGKVDGVCAGLPCPAFSVAGAKLGNSDPRAWGEDFDPTDESTYGPQPHFLRLVEEICPGMVWIENVPGYVTGGHYAPVGEVLHGLGYEYQDAVIGTAESVGASHKRERVFIMAVHNGYDLRARLSEFGREPVFGLAEDSGFNRWGWRGDGDTRGNDGEAEAEGLCGELAGTMDNGECAGLQGCTEGREFDSEGREAPSGSVGSSGGTLASQSDKELEHKQRERLESGCNREGATSTEVPSDRFRALPLHAPGIDNWMAWSSVAVLDKTRMPSLERGVPVVAVGSPPSNVDLLRMGGNCVDVLEATTGIGCLLDRWFESGAGS